MTQSRISLDGVWEFRHIGADAAKSAELRPIMVPGPWQAQFADLRMRGGVAVYSRAFDVPAEWLKQRVFLRFGAVFHIAHVSVNDVYVGSHVGGFLPFHFDITEQLGSGGRATLEVRVESPTDDPAEFPHAPFAEIPFGKQSWYGPLSGIWQSVYLERRTADHISTLRVFPKLDSGDVTVKLCFEQGLQETSEIVVKLFDAAGERIAVASEELTPGAKSTTLKLRVASPQPWSPDTPTLYLAQTAITRNGVVLDQCETRFGFRTIETRDGRLYLNGAPFYMRGALDQDYYPDTICATPSAAFLEDKFRKAKELGLNVLRCHIKAPDPVYYEVADRVGLLIWAELPNGGCSTERSRQRKEALMRGIVDRDGNHPSIFCWTLINENWGVDLVHDARHRAWLKKLYLWLKSYDPSRLVVDNSPLAPSFHVQTDLADYHFYAAIPDSRQDWDDFVDGLAGRAGFLFSPEGDAFTTGKEPLLCSEFGNWGLPDPEKLKDAAGREPWWFETGHDWGEGVMYPHGVENRFHDWSLDRVFGAFANFVEAAQWQQFRALKYQIGALRRRKEIAGYVVTELTDCHWESNGLLDMRSNVRAFHSVFPQINGETVVLATADKAAVWSGETVEIALAVAHGGPQPLPPGALIAGPDGAVLETPEIAPGDVLDLGRIRVTPPAVDSPSVLQTIFPLHDREGREIARASIEIAAHPRRAPPPAFALWSPQSALRERLRALGYAVAAGYGDAQIVVTTHADAAFTDYVRAGGRGVLLPEGETTLTPFFPHWQNVRVLARANTPWRGDWASSFAWLRRNGRFRTLPGGPLLDASFERVIPTHVVSGCNLLDFHARVHAGLAVGWIHRVVALSVERRYGDGHIAISTFRLLRDPPGADPTATALLDGLIAVAAGETLAPSAPAPAHLEPVA